jgi:outer membrane biosynthesis protein TonB
MSTSRFEELYEIYCDGALNEAERGEFLRLLENPACRAQLVRFSTYEAAIGEEIKLAGVDAKPSSRTNPKVGSRRIPIQTPEATDEARLLGRIGVAAAAAVILILVLVFITSKQPADPGPVVVRPKSEVVTPKEPPVAEAPKVAPEPTPAPKESPAPAEDPLKPRTFVPALPKKEASTEVPEPPVRPEPKSPGKAAPTKTEEPRESTTFVATIERVTGEATIGSDPAEAGKGLAAGKTVATGRSGYVSFKYPDGTRVELAAETTLSRVVDGPAGKSAFLDQGMIQVEAMKQPAGRPLAFSTAQAESTVLGTQFVLSAAPGVTRLDVREGRVKFTRLPQAVSSVVVREGHYAIAGPTGDPAAKQGIGLWKAPPAGLLLWLRADQGVKTNGPTVAAWLDQSAAGNSAVQDKPGAQPTLVPNALAGRPSIRFDGSDDFFALPDGFSDFRAGLTAFVVARPAPGGAWSRFIDLDVGPACENIVFGRKDAADKLGFWVYTNSSTKGKVEAPGAVTANEVQSFCALLAPGGKVTLYKNGTIVATGETSAPKSTSRKPNTLAKSNSGGGDPLFKGELFEILLYSRALSEAERAYVESYLNAKYLDPTVPPPTFRPAER